VPKLTFAKPICVSLYVGAAVWVYWAEKVGGQHETQVLAGSCNPSVGGTT